MYSKCKCMLYKYLVYHCYSDRHYFQNENYTEMRLPEKLPMNFGRYHEGFVYIVGLVYAGSLYNRLVDV